MVQALRIHILRTFFDRYVVVREKIMPLVAKGGKKRQVKIVKHKSNQKYKMNDATEEDHSQQVKKKIAPIPADRALDR